MEIKSINVCFLFRKRLLVLFMRTFILLLCTTVFSFNSGSSFSQEKIIINKNQLVPVDYVFEIIQRQSNYYFIYPSKLFKNKSKVQLKKGEIAIVKLLDDILSKNNLYFEITNGNTILIKEKELIIVEEKQQKTISGKVVDNLGQPLPGANVLLKGTQNVAITDFEGNFSITVPDKSSTIVVSFIGFITKEIAINNQTVITIVLEENAEKLDELVVVGYGTSSKTKFNGAVSKIKSEDIEKYASSSFEQAILGKMAGVEISQNGRNPGEDSQITIRGVGSLTAGTNPLIVVDGVPLSEGSSLNSISPQDIETISVLKDAASAAIYGSRAANGLILISTKKGKTGRAKINFNTYTGFQSRTDKLELINAYDAAQFFYEARTNGYVSRDPLKRKASDNNITRIANGANKRELILDYTQPYLDGVQGLTDFDWLDAVYRTAQTNNYHLSISGATDKTDYYVSLGYLDQEGIVLGTAQDRYTINFRLNTNITDKLKYGINLNTSYSDLSVTGDNGWNNLPPDPGASFILMYPFFNAYNEDGSYAISTQIRANTPQDGSLSENTVAMTLLTKNIQKRFRSFGSTFFIFEPIEDLKFKTSLGADFRYDFFDYYSPSTVGHYRTDANNSTASSTETKNNIRNYIIENTIDYTKILSNKHNFNLLLGQSYQQEELESTYINATGIVDDNLNNIAAGNNFSVETDRSKWAQISYFGRFQYDYNNRYFLSASLRSDGSSRFGDNSKWGTFKSFSGGWAISNEAFFPKEMILNHTKLRVSWGETGNNQIGAYSSQALVEDDTYTINGQLVPGFATSTSPNPDLSWETNTSFNIGLDLGFLNSRLTMSIEYYRSNTTDLLLNVPVPQQSGFSSSLQNLGELENRGWEFELSGNDFSLGKVSVGFNVNVTTNTNEVKALGPSQNQIIADIDGSTYLTKVGQPMAQFYGYDVVGVYKTQQEINDTPHLAGTLVGDYVVKDTDQDGDVDSNDRIALGTYNPDFTYSFGADFAYKNFDFSFNFTGVEGRKVYDSFTARSLEVGEGFTTASQYYYDNYYHPVRNPDGFFAAPNLGNFSSARRNTRMSSINVTDADYLRLRNIQLGYRLPKKVLDPAGISNLRLYLTANNLFTITKFQGLNSEGIRPGSLTRGYVRSTTSIPRLIAMGLDITF